ncbi:MAG TPA: Sir2 family NAD-dependent protein deacetylase, partial [Kofleriaceae bacterium]|nr:Sir2 family NAD-dependent protein deacetylase [Kofleriaceae bacterium]
GWPAVARARPNPAHRALAALERRGALAGLITQNVDGLHGAAGSRQVVELHGALARVRCVDCDAIGDRAALQERLVAANPHLAAGSAAAAPDGDADLDGELIARTAVVPCDHCGGPLRPDVVSFGDCVPAPVLARAWQVFDRAEVLLVVGSSLSLHSGYRFVRRAAERGVPVAIVNLGPTRGDREAAIKLDGRAGEVLPALARRLL